MSKLPRRLVAVTGTGAVCALVAIGGTALGAPNAGKHDSGTVYAAITHTANGIEYIAGNASDKLLGSGAIAYTAKVGTGATPGTLKVTANVTLFTKTGSLSGKATATATTASDNSVTFTNGKITLNKGAGLQKGHSFKGTFTGSAKSILGPFTFHDSGTYK
jgi:hypothetical protein